MSSTGSGGAECFWGEAMTHTWRWKKYLPDRFGQGCRVIARGKLNSALVEFEDGYRVITSRYAVRKKS